MHAARDLQSWYVVTRSKTIGRGQVQTFDMLHRKVAVYRGADGIVRATDARCAHLGANLGHGKVVGNGLKCAFHGWCYDENGRCLSAPGLSTPPHRKLRHYPVQEKWGLIWIFNGPRPLFELPDPEDTHTFLTLAMPEVHIPVHPHLMIANGLDATHFEELHQMQATRPPTCSIEAPYRVTVTFQGKPRNALWQSITGTHKQDILAHFTTIGGNIAWLRVEHPLRFYAMFTGKPDDANGCRSRIILFLPKSIYALQMVSLLYLLLHDDRRILKDIDFIPGFVATDTPLQAFMSTVNAMETA